MKRFVYLLLALGVPVLAHEGEDHGPPTAPAVQASVPRVAAISEEFELVGEQAVRGHGNVIVALSRAESDRIEKASGTAVEKWITQVNGRGIDGRKMVNAARASIEKYRGK